MSTDVTLPTLGESVREATVSRWMKAVGDSVTRDEPLLEVSTDKVDTEIPAPVSGVLWEIRFNEDDVAKVGDVLAVIGEADQIDDPAPEPALSRRAKPATSRRTTGLEALGDEAPAPARLGTFDRLLASLAAPPTAPTPQFDMTPYMTASQLADQPTADQAEAEPVAAPGAEPEPEPEPETDTADDEQMEPTRVIVTPGVTPGASAPAEPPTLPVPALDEKHDTYVTPLVRKLAAELGVNLAQVHGSGVGGRIRKQDLLNIASRPLLNPSSVADTPDPRRGTSQAPSPARLARADLATNATLALASCIEVDVTAARAQLGGHVGAIVKAVAISLRVVGELNASLLGDAVVFHNTESIGWVVDTSVGPLAPVIHDASELNPAALEAAIADLVGKSATGSLSPADLAGGTFTVRDDGASGLAWAMPAINRPQVAALSIGCVNRRAEIADDGTVAAHETVYLTLAFDRRVADPGAAASFLQRVKAALSLLK